MNQINRFVIHHPKLVIAVAFVITAVMASVIVRRGVRFDGSPETLARNDSALAFFNETRSIFGDDRVIIIALTTDDVFTRPFVDKLERLTASLMAIKGVSEVQSLTNVKTIRREGDSLSVERLIPRAATDEQLRRLKPTATGDPLYKKLYISEDGRTTAINVFINPLSEEESRAIAEEIEHLAHAEAGSDELMLAGVPIIDSRAIKFMLRDILLISPIAALLGFLTFLFAFRSFWGALLPIVTLMMGNIWTIGLMVWLDFPFTFATLTLPTVLMAIGGSYIFHVLNQYRISMAAVSHHEDLEIERAAWVEGLIFIAPAVIVSATTTMAGFAALATSRVPTARDMGLFEALGVGFLLLLTIAFVPAVLSLLPARAIGHADEEKDYAVWLNGILRAVTAWVLYRRRRVLVTALLVSVTLGIGAIWMRVNTDYLKIFPEESGTVQEAAKLHERLAGAASMQLVISGEAGAAATPEFLTALAALEQFTLAQPGVDAALSVADIVKRFNGVFDASGQGKQEIPADRERLRAMFDDYLSQDKFFLRLVNEERSRAIVILRTNLFGSNELRDLTAKVEDWARTHLPAGMAARATGSFILLNDASDALANSQSSSLALALVLICLMMVILFRSLLTGLLALAPNLLPIICYFGFLGWAGITLDITTSLVASAALGIAVDNAVHMIRRYRQAVKERPDPSPQSEGWVMWLTILRSGKPMVLANLVLIASNLIFMLSSFVPVRTAGLLWVITIAACVAADLIFLPTLMKTKWFSRIAKGDAASASEPSVEPAYVEAMSNDG